MPPKKCGSCEKTVYPTEELKCLDKVWHKACFKCQVCNMTLNMKNYKGYSKLPYCNAHYPETKFTSIADTPENRRLAQNTKLQSQVKYHEEFEKAKGQYTSVADDPETMRVKKNMQTISNVAYHGVLENKDAMENTRPSEYDPSYDPQPVQYRSQPGSFPPQAPPTSYNPPPQRQSNPPSAQPGYPSPQFLEYATVPLNIPYDYKPPDQSPRSFSRPVVTIGKGGARQAGPRDPPAQAYADRSSGRASDYDPSYGQQRPISSGGMYQPMPGMAQPMPGLAQQAQRQPYGEPQRPSYGEPQRQSYGEPQRQSYNEPQRVLPPQQQVQPARQPQYQPPPQQMPPRAAPAPQPISRAPQPQPPKDPFAGKGFVSKAVYDYQASDADEVSFSENDIIIKCEPIDDGWMTGTVERTGQHGMLPSNYVEHLNW